MAILIAFLLVWCVFAVWAMRRKLGATIAWGGGFILGCIALIPLIAGGKYLDKTYGPGAAPILQQAPAAPAGKVNGLGVGYDQLIAAFGPYKPDLKPAPTTLDGRTRMLGKTGGGSAGIMEITGTALGQSVEIATLGISVSNDDAMNDVNANMLGRFLAILFPEWSERSEWAINAIQAGEKESVLLAGKRITFTPIAEMQMLMFTAEAI